MGNKTSFHTLNQKFVVLLLKAFSHIPFGLLYLISDFIYYLIEYVVRYRRKVINKNLQHAFPEKSKKERNTIRKKFYRHFCDMTLESIKLRNLTTKQIDTRFLCRNLRVLQKPLPSKTGMIVLAMHYNNWEWGAAIQKDLKPKVLMVYNRMRDNIPMDDFLLQSREKWGGEAVVMSSVAHRVFEVFRNRQPFILWLAADQSASRDSRYWTVFLNREAAFFSGPVKLAKKLNQPVYFQRIRKLARGRYELEFVLLFENPAEVSETEIIRSYVKKMEEVIKEDPEYYLWSHNRWKHSRPEHIQLIR